jgi:hypothetical protein
MTMSKQKRVQQKQSKDEAVFVDCCSFLHLGALAVSDMLFDDSNVEANKNGNTVPSLPNRALYQSPYMITVEKRHDDGEDVTMMSDDDGYTAATLTTFTDGDTLTMIEEDDDDDDQAADASECDNTLTDISAIVASQLNCSPRFQKRQAAPRRSTAIVSDDDEGSESHILSMNTVHSLFDDFEEEEEDEPEVLKEAMDRRQRSGHPIKGNVPAIVTPKRKKTMRGPYQLKRLLSRGVQQVTPSSSSAHNVATKQVGFSKPRGLFGATSQTQHSGNYVVKDSSKALADESVPFDEPLWYR